MDGRGMLLAPTEEVHLPLRGAGLALGALAGPFAGLRRSLGSALGSLLALGHLGALRQLLALFDLGLDDARRHGHVRQHRLLRIVEVDDALARGKVGQAERVADGHATDVQLDPVGNLHRQRFDVDLADDLGEDAAFLDAVGFADQLDHDLRLDRLVEADFLQIDVDDAALDRILLGLFENRRVRRLLSVEDDVEDDVEAMRAGQRPPEVSLGHADRVRRLPAPVEDAGYQAFAPKAARFPRADLLAFLDLEFDSLGSHGGKV